MEQKITPEKIINLMAVSELLTGKKRNITGYMLKTGRVSEKNIEKINKLYTHIETWMQEIEPECECLEFHGTTSEKRCKKCGLKTRL
jgi:hypothetical protein